MFYLTTAVLVKCRLADGRGGGGMGEEEAYEVLQATLIPYAESQYNRHSDLRHFVLFRGNLCRFYSLSS